MCGVFGVVGYPEAANLAYLGLHALQHRGQESAGIVTAIEGSHIAHRGMGLVQEVFDEPTLRTQLGSAAIGHVRYSTAGGSKLRNAQPFSVEYAGGQLAVSHNGNLTNADVLRRELERTGSIFQSDSDTEVLIHLIARSSGSTAEDRILDALSKVEGAYSLLFLVNQSVFAVRDPHGFRPLCLGVMKQAGQGSDGPDAHVVASEPTSFDLIGAEFLREIEPGEMVVLKGTELRSVKLARKEETKACLFEYVYFARPDSRLSGKSVYETRKALGRELALEAPVNADIVVPVPDSGVPSALGFAQALGIPFELGLVRSHYVGRTFIEPQQSIRHFGVRLKLNSVRDVLRGKRVVLIDDSIVRGTTSRKIVKMVRDAGATEVHLRISSGPVMWPCYYGIDTPTRSELVASSHSIEEIARHVTADSLSYLSIEGMKRAVESQKLCDACFSGNYPVPIEQPQIDRSSMVRPRS